MRYKIVISCILLMCSVSLKADYLHPPLWQGSYEFTHQSWDFNAELPLPVAPDGEPNWVNNFGEPHLIAIDYNVPPEFEYLIPFGLVGWMYIYNDLNGNFTTERRGYCGGMGDVSLTFRIPNNGPLPNHKTLAWIQMTYFARKDGAKNYDIKVARNASFSNTGNMSILSLNVEEPNEPPGGIGKWYRATAVYEINQPAAAEEYIRLTAYRFPPDPNHYMGGAAMIDQVDIDCRSINIADFDRDGDVDVLDFAFFAGQWQQSGQELEADFDKSLSVDFNDLAVFVAQWQQNREWIIGDFDKNSKVDAIDFAFFAGQWRQSGQGLTADFDRSLSVDFNDLAIFSTNWLRGF